MVRGWALGGAAAACAVGGCAVECALWVEGGGSSHLGGCGLPFHGVATREHVEGISSNVRSVRILKELAFSRDLHHVNHTSNQLESTSEKKVTWKGGLF